MLKSKTRKKATSKASTTTKPPIGAPKAEATVDAQASAALNKNRVVTHVNTEEGLKEMAQPMPESEPESEKETLTDGCTNKRRNGMTCIEEMKHAKENPRLYSPVQNKVIGEGRNLCDYCLEQE